MDQKINLVKNWVNNMSKIMILGGGSFGIALAKLLNDNKHDVTIWCHKKSHADFLNEKREDTIHLKGIQIDKNIKIISAINNLDDIEFLVIALPSFCIIENIEKIKHLLNENIIIINASKGFDIDNTEVFSNSFKKILPKNKYVVISGPSHAEEVSRKHTTLMVSSCIDRDTAITVQNIFSNSYMRMYTNTDIIGVEICGALKNIIALAVGIIDGMGMGDNTKAALMTRGLKEISRLGLKLGGKLETFFGISGMGDLIVTCTSIHSRNRRAGILIGQGMKTDLAISKIGTVEGYTAVKVSYKLSNINNIDMPITNALYFSLFENENVSEHFNKLMLRPYKDEVEFSQI